MSAILTRWFDAYTQWMMRLGWFRWIVERTEALDERGRRSGWWS